MFLVPVINFYIYFYLPAQWFSLFYCPKSSNIFFNIVIRDIRNQTN